MAQHEVRSTARSQSWVDRGGLGEARLVSLVVTLAIEPMMAARERKRKRDLEREGLVFGVLSSKG